MQTEYDYQKVKDQFGIQDFTSRGGIWQENHVLCENCKHYSVNVECNLELPGAAYRDTIHCSLCNAEYKAAYVIDPVIILERVKPPKEGTWFERLKEKIRRQFNGSGNN